MLRNALSKLVIEAGDSNKNSRNEIGKLSATFLNGVAIAVIAAGLIVPQIAFYPKYVDQSLGITHDPDFGRQIFRMVYIGTIALIVGLLMHIRALWILRSVEE